MTPIQINPDEWLKCGPTLPRKFDALRTPARYKAFYGGRGAAKTHSFCRMLLIMGLGQPLRIFCAREIQKTLKESVYQVLVDVIVEYGLTGFYRILESEIRGANGTLFRFGGLKSNPYSLKSMEGIDICWVEEANTVSTKSLDLLIPTIRKPGSEIWFSWNPRRPDDPVDKMFRGGTPPPGSIVVEVNYWDNKWFKETALQAEVDWLKVRDYDKYRHVYRGEYETLSSAAVFRNWRVEDIETPTDARFYFGADWGFNPDPSVLVRCWIRDRTLFVDEEAYKVNVPTDYLPALFAGSDIRPDPRSEGEFLPPRWGNPMGYPGIPGATKWKIRADSSRNDTIAYLAARGFDIVGAKKGPGSVEDGIEFLRSYDIVVAPNCKNMIWELGHYAYETDPLTDEVLPKLVAKNDHCIDALRYAVEDARHATPHHFASAVVFTRPRDFPG